MITGFETIVEERIRRAQQRGVFKNLQGAGRPLNLTDDQHVPEDLRLAYKILKNADYLPPEIELKKEIVRTEALLADLPDAADRYKIMKKLNFLIMKVNAARQGNIHFDLPQRYMADVTDRIATPADQNSARPEIVSPNGYHIDEVNG